MAKPSLSTDALVIGHRPPKESFRSLTLFSASHGTLTAFERVSSKPRAGVVATDLFDEAGYVLESGNQGQSWFVKESLLQRRRAAIGRSYPALQAASRLAQIVAINPVPEESREKVYQLLGTAFDAFEASAVPAAVLFKSLYRLARDEGYPVRQQWYPTLPAELRGHVETLLGTPVAQLRADEPACAALDLLQRRLEEYLRGHTDLRIE